MPGGWLLAIARVVFDEVVQTTVVHQAVADMREEWLDAGTSPLGRLLALGRGYVAFWTLVAMAPFVFKARSRRVFAWSVDMSFLKPFRFVAALFVLGLGAGYVYARWQPVLYESSAMLRVQAASIGTGLVDSAKFVQPPSLNDSVLAANQIARAYSRLERIILDVKLYERERQRMDIADVIQLMQSRIAIVATDGTPSAPGGSILVGFTGTDPHQVKKTVEILANMVVEEIWRDAVRKAEMTDVFIRDQLRDAEHELLDAQTQLSNTPAPTRALRLKVETLEAGYKSLLARMSEAKMVTNMEARQQGAQMKLIESPRLPQHPIGPSRLQVSLVGGAVGVAVALFWSLLTFLLTFRDRRRGLAPAGTS